MEPRPVTSHKENVPPRPAAPLRPEWQSPLRRPGAGLGSGPDRWVPACQAARERPVATRSPGAALCQEPHGVQTNLASLSPRLGLVLQDTTGRLVNPGFPQQSNVQQLAARPWGRGRKPAARQSNLCLGDTAGPHHHGFGALAPHRRQTSHATDAPCPDPRLGAGFAPLAGRSRPGLGSWCGLESQTPRLAGAPLTLEDLAVPAQTQGWALSPTAVHQLLASVQPLQPTASWELPGPAQRGPCTGGGWALPAHPWCSQPVLVSWEEKRRPRGPRGTAALLETPGVQAGLSESQAHGKPVSLEKTLRMSSGGFLDSEQGVLAAQPSGPGRTCFPGPTCSRRHRGDPSLTRGPASRETRLGSSAFCSAAEGVLPWQEGGRTLREQPSREEERTATCPPGTAPARRRAQQNEAQCSIALEPQAACRRLLSRCFRAWRRLARRWRTVDMALALSRQRLLRKGLQAFRGALWLQEARLEEAQGLHMKALMAQSFQEWRHLTLQQKQGQPHTQAVSGPPTSGGGQGRGPSSGRTAVVDPAQRCSPGSLRQEEEARPVPSHPGRQPDDGDRRVQVLQVLQCLAVCLLPCHQKDGVRQERGAWGKPAGPRGGLRGQRAPPQAWCSRAADAPQPQRAQLHRCFGAWQRCVQRAARYRGRLAECRVGTLRTCLGWWVQMKHLRASDGAKVTQLALGRQKAGNMALGTLAPGATTAQGLDTGAQEPGWGSLQEACRRLALHRALLLWRTRLCQRQQATSFFQGTQRRTLRCIFSWWRLRAWGPDTPSGSSKTTWALEPRGSGLGEETWLGWGAPRGLLEKAQAQQSWGDAKWCRRILQRRVLLSWSHWTAAQGARRELAACWAWGRSCRAVLGLWRQRLAQRRAVERWARERSQGLERAALRHWCSCWQRQQFLSERYRRWGQVRLRALRRAVFQGWRQAAALRRHVQSYFRAWRGLVKDTEVRWATRRAFQERLRRRALGAAFATWQEAQGAAARAREQRMARVSIVRWRSHVRWAWADRQLRRAQARQAFVAWRGALCQHRESRLGQVGQARAARPLSGWVPEALVQSVAQGHIQETAVTQLRQAGLSRLLWTCWAQWRTAVLRVQELRTQAQGSDLRRGPRSASGGLLLLLTDTPAPWKQTHSCWTQASGPTLPRPTGQHSFSGRRTPRDGSWAQHDREAHLQLRLQQSGCSSWAPSWPPTKPGELCSSETRAPQGQGMAPPRRLGRTSLQCGHLEAPLCGLQASQQAWCLAVTWQHWVQRVSQTLLRQWYLEQAWRTWRRRVVQLRVAQRLRQREDSWVLSQAFAKWHRRLAARRGGASSSPRHPSGPGSCGSCPSPACGGRGAQQRAQL